MKDRVQLLGNKYTESNIQRGIYLELLRSHLTDNDGILTFNRLHQELPWTSIIIRISQVYKMVLIIRYKRSVSLTPSVIYTFKDYGLWFTTDNRQVTVE